MTDGAMGFSSLGKGTYRAPLEAATRLSVDFVELTMNDHPPRTLQANAKEVRDLADAAECDLLVHLPHGGEQHMLASSDDEVRARSRDAFEAALGAAGAIGASKAVIHVDASAHRLLLEVDRWDTLVAAVDDLTTVADGHGIELCVENMRGRTRRRLCPADVSRLVDASAAAMTLDTGHARTIGYSDADIADFLERHADAVSHFHLNDTRGASDDHLPFGAGTTDFQLIFGALPDGWSGTFTLEVGVPDYGYIEVSLARLRDVFERAGIRHG